LRPACAGCRTGAHSSRTPTRKTSRRPDGRSPSVPSLRQVSPVALKSASYASGLSGSGP
jgi:hypothetical protein